MAHFFAGRQSPFLACAGRANAVAQKVPEFASSMRQIFPASVNRTFTKIAA